MRNSNKFSTPRSSPSQKQNSHYADLLQKYGNSTDIRSNKNSKHHTNYIDDITVDKNLISSIFDTPKVIINESIIDAQNYEYQKELTKKMNPRLTEEQKTSLIDRLSLSKVVVSDDYHASSQSTPKQKYNGVDFNNKFINSRFEGVDQTISLTQLEIILRYFSIVDHNIEEKPKISQELLPLCQIDDQSYDSEKLKDALLQSFDKSENPFWLEISNCIKSSRLNGKMKTCIKMKAYVKSPISPNSRKDRSRSISSRSYETQQSQQRNQENQQMARGIQFSDDLSYTTDDDREELRKANYPNIFKDYITIPMKKEQPKQSPPPVTDQASDSKKDIVDKNSNEQTINQTNENNEENKSKKSIEEVIIEEEEEAENIEEKSSKKEEVEGNEEQITKEEAENDKEQITKEEEDINNNDEKEQVSNEEEKIENETKQISNKEAEYNDQISQKEEEEIDQITTEKAPPQKKRKNFHHKNSQSNQNPDPNSKPDSVFQADEYEYNYYSEEQYVKSNVTFDDLIHDAASEPFEDQEFQSIADETSYSKDLLSSYYSIDYDNDEDLYVKVKTRRKSRHKKSPKSQAQSPVQEKPQNHSKSQSYCNRHHHHHHHHRHHHRHNTDNNQEELFDRLKIAQPDQSKKEDVAIQVDSDSNGKNSKKANSKYSSSEAGKYPLTVPIEDVDGDDLKQFEENLANDQK